MKALQRITFDPAVMGGKPCIRGLRVTVGTIVGLIYTLHSREDVLKIYPYLEDADITEALIYAAQHAGINEAWRLNFMQIVDGFPRRCRVDLAFPVEQEIRHVIDTVERLGAHPLLTDAVVHLSAAQGLVADFLELEAPPPQTPPQTLNKFVVAYYDISIVGKIARSYYASKGHWDKSLARAKKLSLYEAMVVYNQFESAIRGQLAILPYTETEEQCTEG